MHTPPPLAERLLRWSLAPDDREAVLGDFQEEFAVLLDVRGKTAATRWYWMQALLSLPPNVVRRLRGDRQRRLAAETTEERDARRSLRRTGAVMSASGVLLFVFGMFTAALGDGALLVPLLIVLACVLLLFGTTLFFGSLSPRPEYDRLTYQLNQRRSSIVWLLFILATLPDKVAAAPYARVVRIWEFLPMLAALAIAVWPRKYWIFGGISTELMNPQVWSPFTSTRREAETIPLDGCPAGSCRVVVTATDGSHASTKTAEFRVGRRTSEE